MVHIITSPSSVAMVIHYSVYMQLTDSSIMHIITVFVLFAWTVSVSLETLLDINLNQLDWSIFIICRIK